MLETNLANATLGKDVAPFSETGVCSVQYHETGKRQASVACSDLLRLELKKAGSNVDIESYGLNTKMMHVESSVGPQASKGN